jgi:hypothetical protein
MSSRCTVTSEPGQARTSTNEEAAKPGMMRWGPDWLWVVCAFALLFLALAMGLAAEAT